MARSGLEGRSLDQGCFAHSLTHEVLQYFFSLWILVNDSGFDTNDVLEDETTWTLEFSSGWSAKLAYKGQFME